MKRSLSLAILGMATLAYLPLSAGAFGFGAMKHEYPPPYPWGPLPPYGAPAPQASTPQGQTSAYQPPPPPYPFPPYARDIKGMWGSGPTMSWGHKFKREPPKPPQWRFTKDWVYVSPYSEQATEQKPEQQPDDNPWRRPPEK